MSMEESLTELSFPACVLPPNVPNEEAAGLGPGSFVLIHAFLLLSMCYGLGPGSFLILIHAFLLLSMCFAGLGPGRSLILIHAFLLLSMCFAGLGPSRRPFFFFFYPHFGIFSFSSVASCRVTYKHLVAGP